MSKFHDITGQKFNKLFVLKVHHKQQLFKQNGKKDGFKYYYLCKCDCGNEVIVEKFHLKKGHTKSCGCLTKKHNLSKTRIYKIWKGIKNRCLNARTPKYLVYGGKGITVCNEWKENFASFYNWAMLNGYKENLTIDRIDVNGNYEPDNCRWVNQKVQQRNKTTNNIISYNNETHCLSEWAEKTGIKSLTIRKRIKDYGYSIKEALTLPKYKHKTKGGQFEHCKEVCPPHN